MKYMQIKNVKLLHRFGINGIVLFPFILYADKNPTIDVINHEQIHWQQIKRDGAFSFYLNYCREYFRMRLKGHPHYVAYRQISYEQEAYAHQKNPDYLIAGKT